MSYPIILLTNLFLIFFFKLLEQWKYLEFSEIFFQPTFQDVSHNFEYPDLKIWKKIWFMRTKFPSWENKKTVSR